MTQARNTLTVFVLATVTFGCGPRWYEPPATAVTPCTGQRYVEVRNTLEKTVEVYAYGTVSGGPSFLGNVSAGATDRIPVGADVGYVYAQVGNQRIEPSARGGSGGVSVSRACEPARSSGPTG